MTRPSGSTILRARGLRAGVLAAALVTLAACGSDDDSSDSSAAASSSAAATTADGGTGAPGGSSETQGGGTLEVTSTDFDYQLDSTELAAGEYTIELTNDGDASHDLVVERDGGDVDGTDKIGRGENTSVTVDLEPGEYVFYCSVGNHRAMGMEVTVTVT